MSIDSPRFLAIMPYLHYENVAAMIDWLTRVFGFKERGRWLDGQGLLSNAKVVVGSTGSGSMVTRTIGNRRAGAPGPVDRRVGRRCRCHVCSGESRWSPSRAAREQVLWDPHISGDRPEGYTWGFRQRGAYVARFEK